MRIFLRLVMAFLCAFQFASVGCVHVPPNEIQAVDLSKENPKPADPGKSDFEYMIYKTTELPLEDFFYNFRQGEYKKAFREIKLNYRPSNFSNKALEELVAAGFIPVYINVVNRGQKDLQFDEKSFLLTDGKTSLKAVSVYDLPREFQHFSPTALAANVYNTGVVVVGFVAVMAALIIATKDTSGSIPQAVSSWPSGDNQIYNDVNRVTKVDYQDYLIEKTTLKPGQSRRGLIFYFAPDAPRDQDYQLKFTPL